MLLSLLFLIVLAIMAYRSQKVILPAVVFGALKAIASCFYFMAESNMSHSESLLLAGSQFSVNTVLGAGIAYLVVKRSQDWKYTFATTALAIFTYLTNLFEPLIVA